MERGIRPELEHVRRAVPAKLCNVPRLLSTMEERDVDGIVVLLATNQYYMCSFPPHHSIPETTGKFPVIFSRHHPEHPILFVSDVDLARLAVQPTWIEDIRPYASSVLPMKADTHIEQLRRFVPPNELDNDQWGLRGARRYCESMSRGIVQALKELDLVPGRVAFDNFAAGCALAADIPGLESVAGEGLMRHVRAGKTQAELELLRTATIINQTALERTVRDWDPRMTWHDVTLSYQIHALRLGGAPNLPDTMAMSNRSSAAFHADLEIANHPVVPDTNIMFDCHGKYDGYCWDGGKSWVVGGAPSSKVRRDWAATVTAAEEIQAGARPGEKISTLVDIGLATYRKLGVNPDGVMIFFHGLGLDHLDQDLPLGRKDWVIGENMVLSTHIYFPGNANERLFLEEILAIRTDGTDRFFTWDAQLLLGC